MLFNLFSYFKSKPQAERTTTEGFKLLYTDSQGNKWYCITNTANIHASRALTAWAFSKDAEYGLTREKLSLGLEKINEAVNKNRLSDVAKVTGVLEAALSLYAEPEIMLNLATCYTFLNNEQNDGFKDFIQEKKREIWNSDPDCRAFFLQWSVQFMQRFSESQSTNVLDYLERVKPVIDQINFQLLKKS